MTITKIDIKLWPNLMISNIQFKASSILVYRRFITANAYSWKRYVTRPSLWFTFYFINRYILLIRYRTEMFQCILTILTVISVLAGDILYAFLVNRLSKYSADTLMVVIYISLPMTYLFAWALKPFTVCNVLSNAWLIPWTRLLLLSLDQLVYLSSSQI